MIDENIIKWKYIWNLQNLLNGEKNNQYKF